MKFQIEDFITKLNTIQCSDSIEFRLRYYKTWLNYLAHKDKNTEKQLLRMIFEYQKFTESRKIADKNNPINQQTI